MQNNDISKAKPLKCVFVGSRFSKGDFLQKLNNIDHKQLNDSCKVFLYPSIIHL